MGGGFQYCPQCRAEVMIARQLGKTVLMVRVEDFTVSEPWLQHQLGISVAAPRLLHTLPSCNTWCRGSRKVSCSLPPPYSDNRRPPVVTDKDDYDYWLPSEGCPAGRQAATVVLDRQALGGCWVPQRDASHPGVEHCVKDRSQMAMDIMRGPLVIDFRPAPELARLEAEAAAAAEALAGVEVEVESRRRLVHASQEGLSKARRMLDGAKRELERVQGIQEDRSMHVRGKELAYQEASERVRAAEGELSRATLNIVEVAERLHALEDDKVRCLHAAGDARRDYDESSVAVMRAQAELNSDLVKYNRAQDALERDEAAYEELLPLLQDKRRLHDAAAARHQEEQVRFCSGSLWRCLRAQL